MKAEYIAGGSIVAIIIWFLVSEILKQHALLLEYQRTALRCRYDLDMWCSNSSPHPETAKLNKARIEHVNFVLDLHRVLQSETPLNDFPEIKELEEFLSKKLTIPTKEMVSRFLSWKLPEAFYPDCYIRFDSVTAKKRTWPSGTNLLNADQAHEMLKHVLNNDQLEQPVTPLYVPAADEAVELIKAMGYIYKQNETGHLHWAAPLVHPTAWIASYFDNGGVQCFYTTSNHSLAVENDTNGTPEPLYKVVIFLQTKDKL